jgi:acyl-CoA thioester hydrolase
LMMTLPADAVAPVPQPQIRVRVEHVDVDSYGVVHFSRYVSLFETATLELMAARSVTLESLLAEGLELRVVELQVKYRRPALYGDVLTFASQVRQCSAATVTFEVSGARAGAEEPEAVVTGTLKMAFVRREDGTPVQVPASIVNRLVGGSNDGEK